MSDRTPIKSELHRLNDGTYLTAAEELDLARTIRRWLKDPDPTTAATPEV